MANKNCQVNLAFTADTSRAKAQLMELQKSLNTIISSPIKSDMTDIMKRDLEEASYAAAELSVHLKNATNQKTGSLDFSKLNQSIKQSGNSLADYAKKLQAMGADGQKAFLDLANAVSMAEVPIRRSSELMAKFWDDLKKTAGWQISSNILHGLESSINSAYHYAQDLNESLNNIRIVTGQNIEQMAEFAAQANKAAKTLNTTTTNYTNASLIYYQQGLSDQEVLERTDVTIKMANVARASAEEVSDQMTAVWNNFYDGSKSLEYYADVMTALGAATASSTEEISAGLNKFAAVAETVGLSYEYAASALATVTSTTRQSADVVGTAFKTLFARIQDLKLGETLDDGTTLGTYSESLAKVGIDIKDVNKEIKDMDTILEEMAQKWKALDKDAQIALAQNVAGVRQYTQLIALMDNWDFFQKNLSTSLSSSGTLNEQAEIYAEGWESAQDRVTAALENIYSKIIDDEAFIDILNGVENIITGVDHLIDSVGGLNGVLATLGTLFTKIFSKQLSQSLTNIAYNMQMMTAAGRKKIQDEKTDFLGKAKKMFGDPDIEPEGETKNRQILMQSQIDLQETMISQAGKMSEIEKEINQSLFDRLKIQGERIVKSGEEYDKALKASEQIGDETRAQVKDGKQGEYARRRKQLRQGIQIQEDLEDFKYSGKSSTDAQGNRDRLRKILQQSGLQNDSVLATLNSLKDSELVGGKLEESLQKLINSNNDRIREDTRKLKATGKGKGIKDEDIKKEIEAFEELARATSNNTKEVNEYTEAGEKLKTLIKDSNGNQLTWADTFVATSNAVMGVVSAFQMLTGLYDTITNPDLSGWEKFTTVLSTVGMLIPVIMSTWDSFSKVIHSNTFATIFNTAAKKANAEATEDSGEASQQSAEDFRKDTKEKIKNNFSDFGNNFKDTMPFGKSKNKGLKNINAKEGIKNAASSFGNGVKNATLSATKFISANIGIISAVGVAALAIGGVVLAYQALDKAYNKDAIAAEKAAKNAKQLTEAYQSTKQAYEDMKSTISGYDDAVNGLDKLTKGTLEFKEQVSKANEEALKLIDTYSGLEYTIDTSSGLIQIDEESLREEREKEFAKLQKTQNASIIANAKAREAQLQADKTAFNREVAKDDSAFSGDSWNQTGKGAAAGLGTGAAVGLGIGAGTVLASAGAGALAGSAVPIVGTIIGAAAGLITGAIIAGVASVSQDVTQTEDEKAVLNSMEKLYAERGESAFTEEGLKEAFKNAGVDVENNKDLFDSLNESLKDENSELKELVIALNANTQATKAENQMIATNLLSDNMAVQNSRYRDDILETSGRTYAQLKEDALVKLDKEGWGTKDISKASTEKNEEAQKVWEEYLIAAGLDAEDYQLTGVLGSDTNRRFEYKVEGSDEAQEITLEAMREIKAAADAAEALGRSAEKVTSIFLKLETSGNKAAKGLKDFLTSENFTGATKGELNALGGKDGSFSLENYKTALEKANIKTDEDAKAFGFDSLADMQSQAEAAYNRAQEQWASINIKQLEGFKNIDIDSLSLEVAQSFENIFDDINFGPKGAQAGEQFAEGLNSMLEGLSEEDSSNALAQLSEIDWSNWNALEQAEEILKSFGKNIDITSDYWIEFADNMRVASGAVEDFGQIINSLQNVYTILQDLDFGKTISEEDYQALKKYQKGWEDFFILQADGTRRFIGNAEDMKDATRKDLLQQKEDLEERKRIQKEFNDVFFSEDGVTEIDWSKLEGSNDDIARDLMNAPDNDIVKQMLKELNYSDDDIEQMLRSQDEAGLKVMYQRIAEFKNENLAQYGENLDEMMASTAENMAELDAMRANISEEAYNKQAEYLKKLGEEHAKSLKKANFVERYKDINAQIEIMEDKINDASKALDGLYGADRIRQLKTINNLIQEQTDNLERKREEAETNKDIDKTAVTNTLKEAETLTNLKLNFTFDEEGAITNYSEVLTALYAEMIRLSDEESDVTGAQKIEEKINEIREVIDQYESTVGLIRDIDNQIDDNFKEWQSNNYENLSYTLEMNIEINDMELEEIDYYLNKISDDFKKMGEAAGLAFDKFAHMEESLKDQGDFYNDLTTAYNRGEISQADYVAGMKEARSAIYENLEAIQELSKEMQEYYGKTLDAFGEKIDENIGRMESMTSVLDHYKNIMGILGKEQDYSRIGIILEGTAKTLKDQIEVVRAEYQFYANEVNEKHALMEQAKTEGNQEVIDLYTKQWEQARDAMIETQDQMLSKTAEWAEAMKAITENKLSKFGEELEKALTGGASFEDMELSLKRTNSLQEEFLTTTNKIYETEKMMRTAQNAIDISTNRVAKQKLQNFIQETKQLQNQGELSKYELEIQQAKYDLLVAEIALKDAQDAKTTVRLKRDAEGNVGYVYTADQQKVDNALQNFEDAQNALYNIGLEGANTYSEKYQQTLQEMHATLTEINTAWLNGEITSEEEYNRKMLEAKEYYYELLSDYSSLYQVALTTDSAVVRDAWMDDHIDMMNNTEEWQLAVDEYTMLSGEAMQEWQSVVNQVEKDTGLSYSKIQQSVKSVKDESNALRDAINGDNGLIKAMGEQINEVDKVVDKYVKEWMPKVIALTDQYEKLAKKIKEAISAESGASSLGGGTEVKEFDKTTDAYQAGYKAGYTLGYEQGYAGTGDKYQVSNHADYNYKKGYDHGYAKGWADGERQREADKKNGSELKYNVEKKNEGYKSAVALMGFDTGGYTGSWGPDGKLAVLHQKEIVLNAADTSNLLASVDLLHNILQVIDVQSMTRQLSGILSSPQFFNNNSQTLEQQVYIEAHFPYATDRNELEAAFNNIINQASQYANRK